MAQRQKEAPRTEAGRSPVDNNKKHRKPASREQTGNKRMPQKQNASFDKQAFEGDRNAPERQSPDEEKRSRSGDRGKVF